MGFGSHEYKTTIRTAEFISWNTSVMQLMQGYIDGLGQICYPVQQQLISINFAIKSAMGGM